MSKKGLARISWIIIAVVIVAAIAAAYLVIPRPPKVVEELKISQKADLSTIDVQAATDAPTLAAFGHVYESLFKVKFDEAGRATFVPNLVEKYEVVDEKTWRFTLRKDVKFHDGSPLTSANVKASFERGFLLPGLVKVVLGAMDKVEIVDDLTFILRLKYPFGPIINQLAHPSAAILSKPVCELYPTKPIDDIKYIVGTGPYKFSEFVKLERTVLVRNEEYWGPLATVEKITWKPIADDETRVIAIETGEVDIATHIPPHAVKGLKDKGMKIVQMPSTRKIYIGIQCERITDVRVRQAFNYAVDKEAIVSKILEGAGSVAKAPICPAIFGYTELTPYPYDPGKASALLAEAGFVGKEIKMIHSTGRYLKDKEIADSVADYLRKVGLKVSTEVLEWAAYIPRTNVGDFDLFLLGWSTVTLDADYGLYSLFHKAMFPPGFNRMRYSNPKIDDLLSKGRASADPAERLKLYKGAQEQIWKDVPWIFLHFEDLIVSMKPGITIEVQPIERWVLTYAKVA